MILMICCTLFPLTSNFRRQSWLATNKQRQLPLTTNEQRHLLLTFKKQVHFTTYHNCWRDSSILTTVVRGELYYLPLLFKGLPNNNKKKGVCHNWWTKNRALTTVYQHSIRGQFPLTSNIRDNSLQKIKEILYSAYPSHTSDFCIWKAVLCITYY